MRGPSVTVFYLDEVAGHYGMPVLEMRRFLHLFGFQLPSLIHNGKKRKK